MKRNYEFGSAAALAMIFAMTSATYAAGQSATQLPLAGRPTDGSASVQQSTGSGTGANVVSSVQVQGNYSGSVPGGDAISPAGLTLADAIQRGLRFNLGAVSASASQRQLRGQRLAALSAMLPDITASFSLNGARTDLQALGLSAGTFGVPVPTVVGPYHYYEAAGNISEQFSLTSLHNYRQAMESLKAANLSAADARELIVLAVGGAYLRILSTAALIASQEAQVGYAEASYKQAFEKYNAGTTARIDSSRSLVELQTQRQRLMSLQADFSKQKLQLARMIGVPLEQDFTLADKLPEPVPPQTTVEQSLQAAASQRQDLKAAEARVRAAEESRRAAKAEYLPSFGVNGSYGVEGINPDKGVGVFQASGTVTIPIWRSGRTKASVEQANAAIDQRRAEFQDQQGVIALDVRNAFIDIQVDVRQAQVARENRLLALSTLQQSRDRYAAGVADTVEVVQAQETLAAAERDYIGTLYSYTLAKLNLARATGEARAKFPDLLKGQ